MLEILDSLKNLSLSKCDKIKNEIESRLTGSLTFDFSDLTPVETKETLLSFCQNDGQLSLINDSLVWKPAKDTSDLALSIPFSSISTQGVMMESGEHTFALLVSLVDNSYDLSDEMDMIHEALGEHDIEKSGHFILADSISISFGDKYGYDSLVTFSKAINVAIGAFFDETSNPGLDPSLFEQVENMDFNSALDMTGLTDIQKAKMDEWETKFIIPEQFAFQSVVSSDGKRKLADESHTLQDYLDENPEVLPYYYPVEEDFDYDTEDIFRESS